MTDAHLRIAYLFQQSGIRLDDHTGPIVHIKAIIRYLRQAGHQVTFVALKPARRVICTDEVTDDREALVGWTNNRLFRLLESAVRRAQRVLRLPYLALFDSLRFYDACIHNLRGYDVFHERFTRLSIGGVLAARRLGVPIVLEVNADTLDEWDSFGQGPRGFLRVVVRWASALCFRLAAAIVAVSEPLKAHLVRAWNLPAEKIVVIPNGADVERFKPETDSSTARARLGLHEAPTVIFVSGFYPWHASLELVESFALVLRQVPTARLFMLGNGQMRGQTETYTHQLGLERMVTFVGTVPHDQIPDWLAAADIAVMPYPKLAKELWFSPLKMYEYMSAGKAIVASRAGQIAEVISDDHTGVLVDPGDTVSFAQALVRLLTDEGQRSRLGMNARRQAVEHHSWDQYARNLETVYRDVLATAALRVRVGA
jgi:glycosyltransferase involved in cell wall biosynthesis